MFASSINHSPNLIADPCLFGAYSKLKRFYSKTEKNIFMVIWANTMCAIDEFKNEANTSFFLKEEKSCYTLDKICQINFTVLSVAIRQVMKENYLPATVEEAIKIAPIHLAELKVDLTKLINCDKNEKRAGVYLQTLNHISTMENIFCVDSVSTNSLSRRL